MFQTLWAWRFTILIGLVLSGIAYIDHRGFTRCQQTVEVANLKSDTQVRHEQIEIRNKRPDTAALLERLQHGEF